MKNNPKHLTKKPQKPVVSTRMAKYLEANKESRESFIANGRKKDWARHRKN